MNYRTTTLQALTTYGISGTAVININIADIITAFQFYLEVTTGAADKVGPAIDAITKLEILDGSEKLLELTGTQIDAMAHYDLGVTGAGQLNNQLSTEHYYNLTVLFGRFLNDPLYAFDPTKFKNPQIRVTYDVTKCEANATAFDLKVIATVFDERAIEPIGFMRNTEIFSYTPTANAYNYVDIPTDLDIRKLVIQARLWGHDWRVNIAEAKLSEDNDKRVPFDMNSNEMRFHNVRLYEKIQQNIWFVTSHASDWIYIAASQWPALLGNCISTPVAVQAAFMYGNRVSLAITDPTKQFIGEAVGWMPWSCWSFPFGDPKDPDDWYKPQGIGSLRLRIKNGATCSSGCLINTFLQQIYKY